MDMRLWGLGNWIFARLHRSDQLFRLLKTGTKSQWGVILVSTEVRKAFDSRFFDFILGGH